MSEAFNDFLEKRQAEMKQREAAQKWIYIVIGILVVCAIAYIALRPDPNTGPVNVNKATMEQLVSLPEVGPDTAAKIIANRPYTNAKELGDKVKGIGPKKLEKMAPRLRFSDE
jgi:DNA uptake protein ComE-like DNA-binding protein